jgi:hypothetical protein
MIENSNTQNNWYNPEKLVQTFGKKGLLISHNGLPLGTCPALARKGGTGSILPKTINIYGG